MAESGFIPNSAKARRPSSDCPGSTGPARKTRRPSGARKTPHVLVVDDEPGLRDLLADALTCEGVRVSTAASGSEAIDQASRSRPDLIITDLRLGDCNGLDVVDSLRHSVGEIPTVVITAYADAASLTEASRRRPVELMTKPLDLKRLRQTVRDELKRQDESVRLHERTRRLRLLARRINRQRKHFKGQLDTTCADLTSAYRSLSGQLSLQQVVLAYQNELIAARSDDDVFRAIFRLFVRRSGGLFGVALVCDEEAQLKVIGRFGVPKPDGLKFCEKLAGPVVDAVLAAPKCTILDAGDSADLFDESIRPRLIGVTVLAIPLLPARGELIGLAVLYRKGEQPFIDADLSLADKIAFPTAVCVRRND